MQLNQPWIWQHNDWPQFRWEATQLSHALAQGKVIGMSQSLNADLTLEALSTILIEDGLTTSAIDGLIELLLDATQNHTQPLSLERLYVWHRALFPPHNRAYAQF